jgi:endoglucanase
VSRPLFRGVLAIGTAALVSVTAVSLGGSLAAATVADDTQFYVGQPNHDAVSQIAELTRKGRKAEAAQIRDIINTPTAVWVEGSSAKAAEQQVRQITHQAAGEKTVPVLVLYNIPFRDCAQYSAGGASSVAEYEAWIDAVVRGIGQREAVIALEPDSLGIIPWYTNLDGQLEWCQPADVDPATAASERFAMLNYAVDALTALPNTSLYLDGTHSAWLNVGDVSQRLVRAGVLRADGFFLNASNYQYTANQVEYGTWISSCVTWVGQLGGTYGGCPNQYWVGGPSNNWGGDWPAGFSGALSPYVVWSDTATDPAANTAGINERYASMLNGTTPTVHFIIDTSRNARGPWDKDTSDFVMATPPLTAGQDLQDWCNPPDRGIGIRPTTNTASPLVDAYVWIKVPGESDGQCSRGYTTLGGVDPAWGIVDPAAGQWFGQQALDLARQAEPPL